MIRDSIDCKLISSRFEFTFKRVSLFNSDLYRKHDKLFSGNERKRLEKRYKSLNLYLQNELCVIIYNSAKFKDKPIFKTIEFVK